MIDSTSPHGGCGWIKGSLVRVARILGESNPLVYVACPGCGGELGSSIPYPFWYHYSRISPLTLLALEAE